MGKSREEAAFPRPIGHVPAVGVHDWNYPQLGITKREYFAAKAMQTLLMGYRNPEKFYTKTSEQAFNMADAMIEASKQ